MFRYWFCIEVWSNWVFSFHIGRCNVQYINVILHFFFIRFIVAHVILSLTSFSSMPMNVLVIRLVTVLLIDSSFTSLRILSPHAFSFTVLSAPSKFSVKPSVKFSVKSRRIIGRSGFPGMNSKHGTCQNVRYICLRPPTCWTARVLQVV